MSTTKQTADATTALGLDYWVKVSSAITRAVVLGFCPGSGSSPGPGVIREERVLRVKGLAAGYLEGCLVGLTASPGRGYMVFVLYRGYICIFQGGGY